MSEHDAIETPGTVPAAMPGALVASLFAELDRASHCEMIWVMDLGWYKQIRRQQAAVRPEGEPEDDEAKWVPSTDDRLMGLPIVVRENGGEPHIEWLTREDSTGGQTDGTAAAAP